MHVNDLPNEILSYIFTIIANDLTINPICLFPVTNACSRWRTIGLSTGNLWSRIVLTYPLYPDYPLFVVTLIDRSGMYPLDILMDLRDPSWEWNEDAHTVGQQEMRNIVLLLLPHAQRWRSIELLTDTWAPIFAFLETSRQVGHTTILEKLYLSRCNAYFAARGQAFQPSLLGQPVTLFGGALTSLDHLQSLALVGVHLDWDQLPCLPNLSLLEFRYHASSVMPSFQQFRSILNNCAMLSHLTIYGWGPIIDNDISQDYRIRLPNITKFSFGVLDTIYAIHFLSLLDLPSLGCLALEDVSRAVYPTDPPNTTLLLKWFCSSTNRSIMPYTSAPQFSLAYFPLHKIVSLELREICTTPEVFKAFLQEVVSVTHLEIYAMDNELLETLVSSSASGTEGCLIPQLRELDCQDIDSDVLLDVVASRALASSPCHSLDHVTLEYVRSAPPSQGSLMHSRLIGAGIEILSDGSNELEDA